MHTWITHEALSKSSRIVEGRPKAYSPYYLHRLCDELSNGGAERFTFVAWGMFQAGKKGHTRPTIFVPRLAD